MLFRLKGWVNWKRKLERQGAGSVVGGMEVAPETMKWLKAQLFVSMIVKELILQKHEFACVDYLWGLP